MAQIFTNYFFLYEKLASAKLRTLKEMVNSHNHNYPYGETVNFSNLDPTSYLVVTDQTIAGRWVESQVPDGFFTGSMIADNSIETNHIVNSTIVMDDISCGDSGSVKFSTTGYAFYKL